MSDILHCFIRSTFLLYNTNLKGETTTKAINGGWGEWTAWSSCSVSCGGGSRSDNRPCDNPTPAHGGVGCSGSASKLKTCNSNECPGNIPVFKTLSQCMLKILISEFFQCLFDLWTFLNNCSK